MSDTTSYKEKFDMAGIIPVGERILIKPFQVEKVTSGGILLTSEVTSKEDAGQIQAEVIALGDMAYQGVEPWCKVGDKIIFAKYAGLTYPGKDGAMYRVLRDNDVVAVINY